ncbi:MAG: ABC transporter permease, partial [Sporichthyaceae bacterium]|nr:ABC transporter permease [Sporichthyaceae bacterium]
MTAFARTPQLLVVATVQGAMFLLIFRYVFGGAIGRSDGVSYVDFMVPGFVVAGVLFSGMAAAAGVAEDLQRGGGDRFRSLPIPRAALAAGRALAETALVTWGVLVTTAIGLAIGFRPAGPLGDLLVALGLCVIFGFAFTWMFITIGLLGGSAQAAQGMSLLVFPLTFVSSAYVAVDTMPGWMQPVARNQPVSAMVDAVRSWVIDDPSANLGHGPVYLTVRALLWAAVLVMVFGP